MTFEDERLASEDADRFHDAVARHVARIPETERSLERMAEAVNAAAAEVDPNPGEIIYEMELMN